MRRVTPVHTKIAYTGQLYRGVNCQFMEWVKSLWVKWGSMWTGSGSICRYLNLQLDAVGIFSVIKNFIYVSYLSYIIQLPITFENLSEYIKVYDIDHAEINTRGKVIAGQQCYIIDHFAANRNIFYEEIFLILYENF